MLARWRSRPIRKRLRVRQPITGRLESICFECHVSFFIDHQVALESSKLKTLYSQLLFSHWKNSVTNNILVERLLKENVDPNQGDEDGLTALHQSCIDDFEELVKGNYQNHFFFAKIFFQSIFFCKKFHLVKVKLEFEDTPKTLKATAGL